MGMEQLVPCSRIFHNPFLFTHFKSHKAGTSKDVPSYCQDEMTEPELILLQRIVPLGWVTV